MTVYGYARVSTIGQNLDAQIEALHEYGIEEIRIFKDKETGKKVERKEFQELLHKVVEGDIIVCTRLDRFARRTLDALKELKTLNEKGVGVVILEMGGQQLDTSTATGQMFVTMLLAFAEYEANLIYERTQEGKAISKKNNPNYREGRKIKYTRERILEAYRLFETHSYPEVEKKTGINAETLRLRFKKLIEEGAIEPYPKMYMHKKRLVV